MPPASPGEASPHTHTRHAHGILPMAMAHAPRPPPCIGLSPTRPSKLKARSSSVGTWSARTVYEEYRAVPVKIRCIGEGKSAGRFSHAVTSLPDPPSTVPQVWEAGNSTLRSIPLTGDAEPPGTRDGRAQSRSYDSKAHFSGEGKGFEISEERKERKTKVQHGGTRQTTRVTTVR